jgi:hypothetical protein
MSYWDVKNLSYENFKRVCPERPETFKQTVELVRSHNLSGCAWESANPCLSTSSRDMIVKHHTLIHFSITMSGENIATC